MVDSLVVLFSAVIVLLSGALLSLLASGTPRRSGAVYVTSLIVGSVLGFAAVGTATWTQYATNGLMSLDRVIVIDHLSAFFLVAILFVCLCTGLFGEGYLRRSETLSRARGVRPWFLILTASIMTTVAARHAFVFLLAWEVMALASFFLIVSEDEHAQVRKAGLIYFVCTHTATLALFLLFALLGRQAGSLDFEAMRGAMQGSPQYSTMILLLALLGFGTKAGVVPLHIWLQEAHPAAPSHVSGAMSGAVIKVGIYGFLRLIWILRSVPQSWGLCLIAAGAASGVGGVMFALAQHDLKRLLAYHSVENIGIIVLGMGLGCLGLSQGRPEVAILGFAGATLHALNHGLFKSLLFLGSGCFHQALGTRDIETGGGLLKTMPWTSGLSLVGAAAISGIPPLNGFVSEWLVFMAGVSAVSATAGSWLGGLAIGSLALIGGLALACFTKAYGALCLGSPRTPRAASAVDPGLSMLWPMGALAGACALIGLYPAPAVAFAGQAAAFVASAPVADSLGLAPIVAGVRVIGLAGAVVLAVSGLLAMVRSDILKGAAAAGPTWGCGFTALSSRVQYTASSFAQPLTRLFAAVLDPHEDRRSTGDYWPTGFTYATHTPDRVLDIVLLPSSSLLEHGLLWAKRLLSSRLQYYMLAVSLFLLLLLVWRL